MELDFVGFVIRISLNFKSQGTEKIELFSQGTDEGPNLIFETLGIADYEYVKNSNITMLNITLWAFKVRKVEKSKVLIYKALTVI